MGGGARRYAWLVGFAVAGGCHDEVDHGHEHGDDPDAHHVRDPATEPCDASNWSVLFPDLRECALAGIRLDGESLRRANLTAADLAGASLASADLFTAVLASARLRAVVLDGAKLTAVDLAGADLGDASLRGANLTNANLAGATLDGAITDETTICPSGTTGPCW